MGGKAMINSAIITSAETAIREMVVQGKESMPLCERYSDFEVRLVNVKGETFCRFNVPSDLVDDVGSKVAFIASIIETSPA
ncbi:MAG: hypothetical protein HN976_02105 [Lentisphaerae bacterium]|jgi:hypothetical protein|nr:hypothetical protein [Lentisphaerota bacterium]